MQANQNFLIAQVVKFLNENGCLSWRCENNGRIDEPALVLHLLKLFDALSFVSYDNAQKAKLFREAIHKAYRPVPCSLKGVADVIGFDLRTGNLIAVEVKVGADRLRPEQEIFASTVKATEHAEYWLVREIDSFKSGWMRKHQPQYND
jgi:hypothetical protein